MQRPLAVLAAVTCLLVPHESTAQGGTGTLIVIVTDESGGVIPEARVQIASPVMIGGPHQLITDSEGKVRFNALPPGLYTLGVDFRDFKPARDEIRMVLGGTIDWRTTLRPKRPKETVVVQSGSQLDPRNPRPGTWFGSDDLTTTPTRRAGFQDDVKLFPGIAATSPSSGTQGSFSVLGSSINENKYLVDGLDITSPSNGAARADPGIDFIQAINGHSIGASVEYGGFQGGVFNIITRQGGERFLFASALRAQPASFTSQPVTLPVPGVGDTVSGYGRSLYTDFSTTFGGPAIHERLWFFGGVTALRDYSSQPGTDPGFPRTNRQDKFFVKLTSRLTQRWRMSQSFHDELWVTPEIPNRFKPRESTVRFNGHIPAFTFGDLTYTQSDRTLIEMHAGRFAYYQHDDPWPGALTEPSRSDRITNTFSGAPVQLGGVTTTRTTAKAVLDHYLPRVLGTTHELRVGGEIERGEHDSLRITPSGERYIESDGKPIQRIVSDPAVAGGLVNIGAVFASDQMTFADRISISLGLRFDHSEAISQDLPARDAAGVETGVIVAGRGPLYQWNIWSPRVGVVVKLLDDGRSLFRASYGRSSQSPFTGEISPLHPGFTNTTTYDFDPKTGDYTMLRPDRQQVDFDRQIRAPHTDEYSMGLDSQLGSQFTISLGYVHKQGTDGIGWTDVPGVYHEDSLFINEGLTLPLHVLESPERIFLLTNPNGYFSTYDGFIVAADTRFSNLGYVSASYEKTRAYGLLASSGTTPGGAQISTVGAPPIFFGRDFNDLTNAVGHLPNERPRMLKIRGAIVEPHTGIMIAASAQFVSGKPWAGSIVTNALPPPQNRTQRILIEPRGSRRLSSQKLLDVRISKTVRVASGTRIQFMVDGLNVLNSKAEEELGSDVVFDGEGKPVTPRPSIYVDPRRVMIGVGISLGN